MIWPRRWIDFVNRESRSASSLFWESETPSLEEKLEAVRALEEALKPASIGELGGFRPLDKNNRRSNWWGGNFLAEPGESVPHCLATGRAMQPIFQIATSELPVVPNALNGIALLQFWLDLRSKLSIESTNGSVFCVRTYDTLDGLVAVGPGYRENPSFPTFPIKWSRRDGEAPSWEDFSFSIPSRVARLSDGDWFFDVGHHDERDNAPLKVGGWPKWIQGSTWPSGSEFIFQLNSSTRGNLDLCGGSVYGFVRDREWILRVDMF